MRWTSTTSSPSSVGKRSRLARRRAPSSRRPTSAESGGSYVFSVATCAGPAFTIGNALTGSSSARRHASISGNSGTLEPLRVVVRRGTVVEAVHLVHAVAVREGRVVAAAGDAELVAYMRSSAKPLQALPLARARDDLDERDLAIASASHRAWPDQLEAARALLAKAPATEDDLECGREEGSRLRHNCSGKHAGMLALCRARDWPARGYRRAGHPVHEGCRAGVAAA